MVLADTSVWVDHLRQGEPTLAAALDAGEVVIHPLIIGELAMGNLSDRVRLLATLGRLPGVVVAHHHEVMALIETELLFGLGVGYIDAHLLAATRLTPDARLWTRDRRLADVARRMGLAA